MKRCDRSPRVPSDSSTARGTHVLAAGVDERVLDGANLPPLFAALDEDRCSERSHAIHDDPLSDQSPVITGASRTTASIVSASSGRLSCR